MNDQDRSEFESLKQRQSELLRQMSALAEQLHGKEAVLEQARREFEAVRSGQASLENARKRLEVEIGRFESRFVIPTQASPSPSEVVQTRPPPQVKPVGESSHAKPPPIPPLAPPIIPAFDPTGLPQPRPPAPVRQAMRSAAEVPPVATSASAHLPEVSQESARAADQTAATVPVKSSFELRLGTYWLVRIGIVMLLTGVVFLGTYAYKNFIGHLGPGGKVGLLYLLSGTLLGLGAWLHRKQESLKNYAQVLFAGGLACVYFSTYAAHHVPTLEVIRSPLLDGALLLAWAGYVVWLADRRKSEVLAVFAVGLAFYSSVMTHVGLFTLYSNLILTVTAVFFLMRNRWATLSFATLCATYGAYAFWRFYHGGEWRWAGAEEGLWKGSYFLISYWALFSAAVFTTKSEQFTGRARAGFLSLNNGAFFTMFILTMLQVRHGGFWKFALVYGSVLLALALLAWQRLREDKLSANAYLSQGLLLVTIGFITHYAGLNLAVILATESLLLTLSNRFMRSGVLQAGAYASAILSAGWVLTRMAPLSRPDLIIGASIGAAMIANAAFSRWKENEKIELLSTILFTVLGLVIWFFTTWNQTQGQTRGLALAIESLGFVLASRPLRNFALRHGALPYAAVAVAWAIYTMNRSERAGLYIGLGIGAVVLLDDLLAEEEEAMAGSNLKPLFTILALVIWFWTTWIFAPVAHLAPVLAGEGLLFLLAYHLIRSQPLTVGGLVFIFIAQVLCVLNLLPKEASGAYPEWMTTKLPWWNPVVVGLISLGVTHWARRQHRFSLRTGESEILQLAFVLPIVGILFFFLHPHFTGGGWLAFTALLALLVTIYGLATRLWVIAAAGQIYIVYSVLQFVKLALLGPAATKPGWHLALVPAVALLVLSMIARRKFTETATSQNQQWLRPVALFYRGTAVAISIGWVFRYISEPNYIWVLAILGLACFVGGGLRKSREFLVISTVYTAVAFMVLWSRIDDPTLIFWPNLLVIVLLLAQQGIAQRQPTRFNIPNEAQVIAIVAGLISLWLWISKWVTQQAGGFYLTATWAGLALLIFGAGFVLRDKIYRWSGLAVLTCALGRVVVIDIWRLETIYRILSFMALGIVLLVLGFIYNKYQEKIRQWL